MTPQPEPLFFVEFFTLKLSGDSVLLYGDAWKSEGTYAAEPFEPFMQQVPIKLPPDNVDTTLAHHIFVVTQDAFMAFEKALVAGSLDTSVLQIPDLPAIRESVFPRPSVIQLDRDSEWSRRVTAPAPEGRSRHRLSHVTTYWPHLPQARGKTTTKCLTLLTALSCSSEGLRTLRSIAERLEAWSSLSFTNAYAQRLGCFEVHSFHPASEQEQFSITIERAMVSGKLTPIGITIHRPKELRDEYHVAQVIFRNIHDITLSELAYMPPGVSQSRAVTSREYVSEASVQIYSGNGRRLVYHEHWHSLRGVGFEMQMITARARISDKFSSTQLSNRPKLQEQVESVTYGLRSKNSVVPSSSDPWYLMANEMHRLVAMSRETKKGDRFFPRSDDEQVSVILHLKGLIEDIRNAEVIIADPFFDSAALGRVIARITSAPKKFTVITSLFRKRDDGETSDSFARVLERNRRLLPSQLSVVSVVRGDDQAFHDRYVYLKSIDGKVLVYMLSNSLNNAASRWPFCISALDTETSLEVGYYLENLKSGRDVHNLQAEVVFQPIWPRLAGGDATSGTLSERKSVDEGNPPVSERERVALAWLLGIPLDSPSSAVLQKAEGASLILKDPNTSGRFVYSQSHLAVLFEDACLHRPPTDAQMQMSLLLGIGMLAAKASGEGELLCKVVQVLPSTAWFSVMGVLNQLSQVHHVGIDVEDEPSLTGAAIRSFASRREFTMSLFDEAQVIIGERIVRCHDWGVWWISMVAVFCDPPALSEWTGLASLDERSLASFLSGWDHACERFGDILDLDSVLRQTKGHALCYLLCHALGGYRIRPLYCLEQCAKIIEHVQLPAKLRAQLLLHSYKIRPRHQDSVSFVEKHDIGLLAMVWPSEPLIAADYSELHERDVNSGPHCLPMLAELLNAQGHADRSRGLDVAIVEYVKAKVKVGATEHILSTDVDDLDAALVSWKRVCAGKPLGILSQRAELNLLISEVMRPFASALRDWPSKARSLACSAYLGSQIVLLFESIPRKGDFEPDFFLRVVLPVLSVWGTYGPLVRDPRVHESLIEFSCRVVSTYRSNRVIQARIKQIAGSALFCARLRKVAEQILLDADRPA